jgi:hypothetical protein
MASLADARNCGELVVWPTSRDRAERDASSRVDQFRLYWVEFSANLLPGSSL